MKILINLIISMAMSLSLFADASLPTKYQPQSFDIISYKAKLDLNTNGYPYLLAECDIYVHLNEKTDTSMIYFHLAELTLDSLLCGGKHIEYNQTNSLYSISASKLPQSELDKDTITLKVYYQGAMKSAPQNDGWAGVINRNGIVYAMGVGFRNPEVSATRYWLPCYDHPSDKAKFKAQFIVPAGKTVASLGEFSVDYLDNGTDVYTFTHDYETATYLMTFAIGDYFLLDDKYSELPIHIYSLATDTSASRYYYRKVPEMLNAFEKRFGEYPFEKVGYVNTPTGSMEHQTMVSMDASIIRSSIQKKDSIAMTAAHELAHQWFGNAVSPLDFREAWLNEGFATFCEAIWTEELFGFDSYLTKISSDISNYFSYAPMEGILSLYDFSRKSPSSNYPLTIYKKGSAVIALLRYKLGDDMFFEGIRNYIDNHKHSNATTEGLREALEETSGIDLSTFFEQWVYAKGYPILELSLDREIIAGADSVVVTIKQIQKAEYPIFTDLPLELSFFYADEGRRDTLINLSGKEQSFVMHNLPPIKSISGTQGRRVRTLMQMGNYKVVSVKEQNLPKMRVYPNPSGRIVKIEYDGSDETDISITNLEGVQIFERKMSNGNFVSEIDLSIYPQGAYLICITSTSKQVCEKLIIQN